MSLRRPVAFGGTVAVMALAGGCGGSDRDDKWKGQANDACRAGTKEIKAASGKAKALVAAERGLLAELRAVKPPADQRAKYERWVQTQRTYYRDFEAALSSGDQAKINALDEHTGDELADELGLDACKG